MYTPVCLIGIFSVLILMSQIDQSESRTKIRDLIIDDQYDADVGPQLDNGKPVEVNVTFQIVNFRNLEEKDLSFTVDCYVYLSWEENRITSTLGKQELTLPSTWLKILWIPSIYFKNGIKGVNVFMASRVTIQLLCDLDFRNFPHDWNICNIDFMALSERNDLLKLNWNGFKISRPVYNPDFTISQPNISDCSAPYTLGTYSCLRGSALIKRLVRRYFLRKYYPTFLIVCTSFLGFFVPTVSYPARACILTISLLSLITQQVQSQPVRSMYTISYNVWSNACIGLVSLALIEFGWAIIWEEKHKAKKEESQKNDDIEDRNGKKKSRIRFCYKYSPNCNLVDAYSRLLFPLAFCIFIISYICYVNFRV